MGPIRLLWSLGFAILLGPAACTGVSRAQPPTLPHARLWTVTPCGGQAGTTTRVILTGADLDDCGELRFSQTGIQASPAPDPANPGKNLPLQFDVRIDADAPRGIGDVRAIGRYGISNPRAFVVGDLPETAEAEPNQDWSQAQPAPMNIVINGVVAAAADVDYFQFEGQAGQTIVAHCAAETIDSRLDPELQLYDASGRRLASSRRYQGREAQLALNLPTSGLYHLRLCQHAHQAGDAYHFYRLTITTRPWALAATPPVVARHGEAMVELVGYNLPAGESMGAHGPLQRLTVPLRGTPTAPRARPHSAAARMLGFEHRDWRPAGFANALRLGESRRPVMQASEGTATVTRPQVVSPPCELVGRLLQTGPMDWFRFTGKKDQALIVEGFAERLGAPLDLYFELRRADTGQLVGEYAEPAEALGSLRFFTRAEDPKARLALPADGDYLLGVGSRMAVPGEAARQVYRVSLRAPEPDFQLVAVDAHPQSPGALQLARGTRRALEVHVLRREGFSGPVWLRAEGLPTGVSAPTQVIAPGADQLSFVFSISSDAPAFTGAIKLIGQANVAGQMMERVAEAGCLVWPNPGEGGGVPALSRLCHEIAASVRETPPFTVETKLQAVSAAPGGVTPITVRVNRLEAEAQGPLSIIPLALPPGAIFNGNNAPAPLPAGVTETNVAIILPPNLPTGPAQITLAATGQIAFSKDAKAAKAPVTVTEAAMPATVDLVAAPAEVKLAPLPAAPSTK